MRAVVVISEDGQVVSEGMSTMLPDESGRVTVYATDTGAYLNRWLREWVFYAHAKQLVATTLAMAHQNVEFAIARRDQHIASMRSQYGV